MHGFENAPRNSGAFFVPTARERLVGPESDVVVHVRFGWRLVPAKRMPWRAWFTWLALFHARPKLVDVRQQDHPDQHRHARNQSTVFNYDRYATAR